MKIKKQLKLLMENFNTVSNCDYVVFRLDGTKITTNFTKDELQAIYAIVSMLPFPMNLNSENANFINKLISAQQTELLDTHEKKIIQESLKTISDDLYVIPVPKSTLQFYLFAAIKKIPLSKNHMQLIQAIQQIEDQAVSDFRKEWIEGLLSDGAFSNDDSGKKFAEQATDMRVISFKNQISYFLAGKRLPDIDSFSDNMDSDQFNHACHAMNFSDGKQQIWSTLNAALVNEFFTAGCLLPTYSLLHIFIGEWIGKFYTYATTKYMHLNKHLFDFNSHFFIYDAPNLSLLERMMRYEAMVMLDNRFTNTCIIYRSVKLGHNSDYRSLARYKDHSLSFSFGLCEYITARYGKFALIPYNFQNQNPLCWSLNMHIKKTNNNDYKRQALQAHADPAEKIAATAAKKVCS